MPNAGDGDRVDHGIQDGTAVLGEDCGTFLARRAGIADAWRENSRSSLMRLCALLQALLNMWPMLSG